MNENINYILANVKSLNYLAVLVAGIANFAIGAVWYNPKVFGGIWMKAHGVTMDGKENLNMAKIMTIGFITSLLPAFGIATVVHNSDLGFGITFGAFAGIFLVMMNHWKHNNFLMKPMSATLVDGMHDVITFIAMGAILSIWP